MTQNKKSNIPAYQKEQIEPKQGGKSLLHNEFGFPIVPPEKENKEIEQKPISNQLVMVKATVPKDPNISKGKPRKGMPSKSSEVDVPVPIPNIGNNEEHTWHSKDVTGFVDNNQDVDVESLQGVVPLADKPITDSPLVKRINSLFTSVSTVVKNIPSKKILSEFKVNLYDKRGPLYEVLVKAEALPTKEALPIKEVINDVLSKIALVVSSKEYELDMNGDEEDEMEPDEREPEEEPEEELYEAPTEEEAVKETFDTEINIPDLKQNEMLIIVNDEPVKTVINEEGLKAYVEDLLYNKDISLDNIKVIKRLKIDFGLLIEN